MRESRLCEALLGSARLGMAVRLSVCPSRQLRHDSSAQLGSLLGMIRAVLLSADITGSGGTVLVDPSEHHSSLRAYVVYGYQPHCSARMLRRSRQLVVLCRHIGS